ncbi:MAG: 16S rRNA (cytosine(967)-C(5))-methyltransferase RsmB [Magnetococcus sp. YQC-5]
MTHKTIDTVTSPRRIAVDGVVRVTRDALALELNPGHLSIMSVRDRALAFEIATGTVRYLSLLDALLTHCMPRPPALGRHFLWAVMRTALYQARWMRIPARAAIHEAVNLIKHSPDHARAGFVNAVLRNSVSVDQESVLAGIADPVERLATANAHPVWLVRRWIQQVGLEQTQKRLAAGNMQAPLVLRVNRLVTDPSTLLAALGGDGESCWPDGIRVSRHGSVESLPGYQEGWFAVQDAAAQWASCFLDPQPGEDVLDVCAAPGGKTAHLAALAQGRARICAVDRSAVRLQRLHDTVSRLQVPGVEVIVGDATDPALLSGRMFHKVLLDVPCSGTGVIRRHPEIKWRRHADDPLVMAALQRQILAATAARVCHNGILVYAVCSMEPEEGEEQIRHFLAEHGDWERVKIVHPELRDVINPEGEFRSEPGWGGMDGFFIARLRRRGGVNE